MQFVDNFKHLGTTFSMSHDLRDAICVRAATIRSVGNDIKRIIKHGRLALRYKLILIKARMLSSGAVSMLHVGGVDPRDVCQDSSCYCSCLQGCYWQCI